MAAPKFLGSQRLNASPGTKASTAPGDEGTEEQEGDSLEDDAQEGEREIRKMEGEPGHLRILKV